MTLLSKISIASAAVVVIFGAAITRHFAKIRATSRKLVEEANATRARAEQGDANAEYHLASLYYQGKGVPQSYTDAFRWYQKAADQGTPKGEYGVAYMYYWGLGVQQDYAQAFQWYRKAADQGYERAQYDLSYLYKNGQGVPKDVSQSLIWCRKAADQGYPEAQYVLGNTYFDGKYLPQDYSESVLWYQKAADQGYPQAQNNLGYMYYQGLGVRQDYARAARWYRKAASHGDDHARRALRSMGLPLTPFSKVMLVIMFLWSTLLLVQPEGKIRNMEQRTAMLLGLLGLLKVGLDLYGHFDAGTMLALSAVNPFFFVRGVVSSAFVAVIVYIVWPRTSKIILPILAIPFLALHVYAAMHYGLRYLALCPRAFYSTNGWLIGTAIMFAILRWAQREPIETPSDNQRLASGSQLLGM